MPAPETRNGQTAASAIVERCEHELIPQGFSHRRGTTLWRRTNVKYDVLKFEIIPPNRCQRWRVPLGSFGLEPSCLFPFLPRIGHSARDGLSPDRGYGQLRLGIRKEIRQREVEAPNLWWAGDTEAVLTTVLSDVLNVIYGKIRPFFHRFNDPNELLRTLIEDDDPIGRDGPWEFGKFGSPQRLLLIGFTALECGEWELARSNLSACNQRILQIPEPSLRSIQREYSPFIEAGVAHSVARRPWSLD
jgi:hypothetical protein